ncbi:MAG: DUF3108 domain-containing protein [Sulfurimonas sp.]|nr:DUF3108 domain-containing protein [Sulfurimonas sp.]
MKRKTIKKLLIIISLSLSLFGYTSVKELRFESGISIYGQIGFVDVVLEENFDKKTYRMEVVASSIGIARILSRDREETFVSEGKMENGVYLPTKFTKRTVKTNYERVATYTFDYSSFTVIKTEVITKNEINTTFDFIIMEYVNTEKLVVEKSTEEIELESNDFLSLYLNLKKGNLKIGKISYVDKKEDDSLFLLNDKLIEVQKNHGDDKYNIVLYCDGESIFFQKAVSEGIFFYGDAYIKKLYEKTDIIN